MGPAFELVTPARHEIAVRIKHQDRIRADAAFSNRVLDVDVALRVVFGYRRELANRFAFKMLFSRSQGNVVRTTGVKPKGLMTFSSI